MKSVKINLLLCSLLCVFAGLSGQNSSPASQRSIGVNVGQLARGQFPSFLYQKRKEKVTVRMEFGLGHSQFNRVTEQEQSTNVSRSWSLAPSYHFGFQKEWGNDWLAFYAGPELGIRYTLFQSFSSGEDESALPNDYAYRKNRQLSHTPQLSLGGVLGFRVQVTERFSLNFESKVFAYAETTYGNSTSYERLIVNGMETIQESSNPLPRSYQIGGIALSSFGLYANLHF